MMPEAIKAKIADCWHAGLGLKETVVAVKRLGVSVEREDIRQRFVALAEGWAG